MELSYRGRRGQHSQSRLPLAAVIILALVAVGGLFAQPAPSDGGRGGQPGAGRVTAAGSITGQVYDADLNVPIEYANIVLRSLRDSSQVNGTVTDKSGHFTLPGVRPGRYFVEVSFIGYRTKTLSDIALGPGAVRDLGRTSLRQTAVAVQGVEATAERPRLEYRIDKKIVDVAHQPTPPNGTAVDALENVPSVKVDDDGNVSLRGSGSFKVLVDGRPSPLDGSEALQQIPASTIDNIEIITNPSAKFDAEGPAGIINVVLKKQRQSGVSSIANLKGGTDGSYGGDFLLGYRLDGTSLYAGADYNRRSFPGTRNADGWTVDSASGDTTFLSSSGTGSRNGVPYGARAGADIQVGKADRVSVGGRFGQRSWSDAEKSTDSELVRPPGTLSVYTTGDTSSRSGLYYSANADEVHNFGREGHDLALHASYRSRGGSETSTNSQQTGDVVTGGQRTKESGPSQDVTASLDYTLPLREEDKFEAGYQAEIDRSHDSTGTWTYNLDSLRYLYDSGYSHVIASSDDVHALYSTYTGSLKPFGFELGLRGEYAHRAIELVDSSRTFAVGGLDFFPTLHLSYELAKEHQVMGSYTRRIERPDDWELEPFLTWWNPHLVRRGNPDLKPEYIDSYELGYQMPAGPGRVTLDGYYRMTHNKVEDVTSNYAPGVLLRSVANVGTDHSAGAEIQAELQPLKWLGFSLTGDVYDYRVNVINDSASPHHSFNWEGNASADVRLTTDTRIQLRFRYSGPSATAQGTESGHFMTTASVRQQLFSRRLSISFQAIDLLRSAGHEETSQGDGFYTHFRFRRTGAPTFSLGLTWNFNNFKADRRLLQEPEENIDNGGDFQQ
jgi:outer membrane receptor protein involved in Fe transport